MKKPATVSQLYPSKWLKAEDLNGRSVVVTIKKCTVEEVRSTITNSDEWRAILDFGRSKRLVLNKTQCQQLTDMSGTETFDHWTGIPVMLAPATARNGKPTISIMHPPNPTAAESDEQEETPPGIVTEKEPLAADIVESGEAQPGPNPNSSSQPTEEDFLKV